MQTLFIVVWQFVYAYFPHSFLSENFTINKILKPKSSTFLHLDYLVPRDHYKPFKYSTNLKSFHAKLIRREYFNAFNPKTIIAHNTQENMRDLKSSLVKFAY